MRGLAVLVLGLAGLTVAVGLGARDLRTARDLDAGAYAGSPSCRSCHPDHTESWRRTFHRTMTQEASTPGAVLGNFADQRLRFDGVESRFGRSADGGFVITTLDARHAMKAYDIARTVGSRRVQQYVAKEDDRYVRLPLAWDVGEQRWLHLNGGFLDPDGLDFNTHRGLWDANCIFCHNVKAQPGYDWDAKQFDSKVAELGVACEACHGPGAEHARVNQNPVRRYLLHALHWHDPTVVDPLALDPKRQVQVCGHCHGQRLPRPQSAIREFLGQGDPYTAGDDLGLFTEPLAPDSVLPGVDVAARFWKDGTPRLTAYEYQALLLTRDYREGNLTCQHCHRMHEGDVRGMIPPVLRGAQACASCHAQIVAHAPEHAHHTPGSSGTDCYACHLPKITYGVMSVHPTHRISVPDPTRAWRLEMPEACTLCHLDRTAGWAAVALSKQLQRAPPSDLPTGETFQVAENVRAMFAGDVVQRAVAVMALGDEASGPSDARARLWAVPFLLLAMEDDYASVRLFADRALRTLVDAAAPSWPELAGAFHALPRFEPQAPAGERAALLQRYRDFWSALDKASLARPDAAVPLDEGFEARPDVIARLRASRPAQSAVQIGE